MLFRRSKNDPDRTKVPLRWVQARDATIADLKGRDQRWQDGVNSLLSDHQPKVDSNVFQVGWSGDKRIWCRECSRPWPCKTFNDLRWLFGHAHDWEPDTRPYLPLVLPAPEEPVPDPIEETP